MRYLKSFNESLQFPTDPRVVLNLLKAITPEHGTNISIYDRIKIHPDGTVDVIRGSIKLNLCHDFHNIPIKFGIVDEVFDLRADGNELWNLEGSPHTCGSFRAECIHLLSLVGGPKLVKNDYDVEYCDITNLEGGPEEVGGYFDISNTNITSLKGGPKFVGGNFIAKNVTLTDLVGSPITVGGDFTVDCSSLRSLEGAPREVGEGFYFSHSSANKNLWDPRPLKDCKIGAFYSGDTPLNCLRLLFSNISDSIGVTTENFLLSLDYNYIRGEKKINLFRVKEAISEIIGDIRPPIIDSDGKLYGWTFVDDEGRSVNFDGIPI